VTYLQILYYVKFLALVTASTFVVMELRLDSGPVIIRIRPTRLRTARRPVTEESCRVYDQLESSCAIIGPASGGRGAAAGCGYAE